MSFYNIDKLTSDDQKYITNNLNFLLSTENKDMKNIEKICTLHDYVTILNNLDCCMDHTKDFEILRNRIDINEIANQTSANELLDILNEYQHAYSNENIPLSKRLSRIHGKMSLWDSFADTRTNVPDASTVGDIEIFPQSKTGAKAGSNVETSLKSIPEEKIDVEKEIQRSLTPETTPELEDIDIQPKIIQHSEEEEKESEFSTFTTAGQDIEAMIEEEEYSTDESEDPPTALSKEELAKLVQFQKNK